MKSPTFGAFYSIEPTFIPNPKSIIALAMAIKVMGLVVLLLYISTFFATLTHYKKYSDHP